MTRERFELAMTAMAELLRNHEGRLTTTDSISIANSAVEVADKVWEGLGGDEPSELATKQAEAMREALKRLDELRLSERCKNPDDRFGDDSPDVIAECYRIVSDALGLDVASTV